MRDMPSTKIYCLYFFDDQFNFPFHQLPQYLAKKKTEINASKYFASIKKSKCLMHSILSDLCRAMVKKLSSGKMLRHET